jgi:hypothetical protein
MEPVEPIDRMELREPALVVTSPIMAAQEGQVSETRTITLAAVIRLVSTSP